MQEAGQIVSMVGADEPAVLDTQRAARKGAGIVVAFLAAVVPVRVQIDRDGGARQHGASSSARTTNRLRNGFIPTKYVGRGSESDCGASINRVPHGHRAATPCSDLRSGKRSDNLLVSPSRYFQPALCAEGDLPHGGV